MKQTAEEIIAKVAIVHKQLVESDKINDIENVFETIKEFHHEEQEYYLSYLFQYYFHNNDVKNLERILAVGIKYEVKFYDIAQAFVHIKKEGESVIELLEESILFIKDTNLEDELQSMYDYYMANESLRTILDDSLTIIKENRYVCVHCYKYSMAEYSQFFLDKELLDSIKNDMPYLLN